MKLSQKSATPKAFLQLYDNFIRCAYIWCARTIRECVNIYALLYASDIKMTIYEQTITWSIFNIFSAVERVLEASTAQKPKQCSSPQTLVVIVWFVCSLAQQPNGSDSFLPSTHFTYVLISHVCARKHTHSCAFHTHTQKSHILHSNCAVFYLYRSLQ